MATAPCCVLDVPAECARCREQRAEGDERQFIWVHELGGWKVFCSPMCLVRSFILRASHEELA